MTSAAKRLLLLTMLSLTACTEKTPPQHGWLRGEQAATDVVYIKHSSDSDRVPMQFFRLRGGLSIMVVGTDTHGDPRVFLILGESIKELPR